jgi:restriction endonuclease S subunit
MVYGQTRLGLNLLNVSATKVAVPTLQEQQTIAGLLGGVDATIAEAKQERDGLQLLKASAADALLTGRVHLTMIDDKGDRSSTECQK